MVGRRGRGSASPAGPPLRRGPKPVPGPRACVGSAWWPSACGLIPGSRWRRGAPRRKKTPCPRWRRRQPPESLALRRDPAPASTNPSGPGHAVSWRIGGPGERRSLVPRDSATPDGQCGPGLLRYRAGWPAGALRLALRARAA
ncbi:Hypothetical protein RMHFA_05666 [Roseomonas mucosa]|nr:Hypothetical protein RMHFA_05666 [Roseomonas mucosa]